MQTKHFIYTFFGIFFTILTLTAILNFNNISLITKNTNAVLKYQNAKIYDPKNTDVETIIIGGSSAGNAINAKLFSELSGQKTLNLALVGSFGTEGNIMMAQKAVRQFPNLKNIIMIQSLDIWRRPFSYQGVYSAMGSLHDIMLFPEDLQLVQKYFGYLFNTKIFFWWARDELLSLIGRKPEHITTIDADNDYLLQYADKYSNGGKTAEIDHRIENSFNNLDKQKAFKSLDRFCGSLKQHCFFMHGPSIETLTANSSEEIERINNFISGATSIRIMTQIFSYPPSMMGDSGDHMSPEFKAESTHKYFSILAPLLQH